MTRSFQRTPFAFVLAVALYWAFHPNPSAGAQEGQLDLATEADVRFELGVESQRHGDYLTALEHYLQSQRLAPNKNVVFNIARCFEELGRYPEAFRHYDEYISSDLSGEERAIAESALLRVRPRVARIRVESDPPGATIFLDRRDLGSRGTTPRTLAVEPGTHHVILEADGYDSAESPEVEVRVGEEDVVRVALPRILGRVRVAGNPEGAEIRVDESEAAIAGTTPTTLDLAPGDHTLIVSHVGRQTARYSVRVEPRQLARVEIDLPLETGSLVVTAEERGALIELDGEAVGFTPAVLSEVPSGPHTLRISRAGYRTYNDDVVIQPNQRTTVEARLRWTEEVTAASRQAESIEDAPASVSLVSGEEIRAFGYQTLAEAVAGQRGVYLSNDLTYQSIGLRGFSRPSDYGNRLLVLTDGHTMNDDQLGSSYVGYDARADLMDIERIELIRGPGSALYGTNAFFGVLNLVTRDRDSLLAPHVSIATDAQRQVRARVGASARFSRDVGFWASAAGVYSQGDDYSFPDSDPPNVPVVGADGFHSMYAAARGWAGDFTLQLSFNRHDKRIPTGSFETILGDPRTRARDTRGFAELRWEPRFGRELRLYFRAFGDMYLYDGDFPYADAPNPDTVLHDEWRGGMLGGEARAVITPIEWLRITVGSEFRGSAVAELRSRYDHEPPHLDPPDEGFIVVGGYLVANIKPIQELAFDAGLRLDYVSTFDNIALSPRIAAIARPWDGGTFKLLGGSAFRAPSPYELYYQDDGETQVAAQNLDPERIWTGELEYTHRIDEVSIIASVFYNRIENFVDVEDNLPGLDPSVFRYHNTPEITQTLGGEFEVRRDFRQGWMIAANYSYQRTRTGDLLDDSLEAQLVNSPEHLFAIRGVAPMVADDVVNLAGRIRVESPRLGVRNLADGGAILIESEVPVVVDLIATGEVRSANLSWGLGVRNLLDWRYGFPGGEDLVQTFVPQKGRTFFVQTTLAF